MSLWQRLRRIYSVFLLYCESLPMGFYYSGGMVLSYSFFDNFQCGNHYDYVYAGYTAFSSFTVNPVSKHWTLLCFYKVKHFLIVFLVIMQAQFIYTFKRWNFHKIRHIVTSPFSLSIFRWTTLPVSSKVVKIPHENIHR